MPFPNRIASRNGHVHIVIDSFDKLNNILCLLRLDDKFLAVDFSENIQGDSQHAGISVPKLLACQHTHVQCTHPVVASVLAEAPAANQNRIRPVEPRALTQF